MKLTTKAVQFSLYVEPTHSRVLKPNQGFACRYEHLPHPSRADRLPLKLTGVLPSPNDLRVTCTQATFHGQFFQEQYKLSPKYPWPILFPE